MSFQALERRLDPSPVEEKRLPHENGVTHAVSAAADMRSLVRQVHVAAFQVLSAGTEAQLAQARKVLAQARRSLYRILAEEDEAGRESDDAPAESDQGPS